MAGKIPKLCKMKDVYQYAKEKGLLKTHDGYTITEYEFSKIIHAVCFDAMQFSIENKEQVQLFGNFSIYPVQTKCTRYIPKIYVKENGEIKRKNLDVSKYGYSFAFLFLNTPKKYRGFRFTTADKVKKIISQKRNSGIEFMDITLAAGDKNNSGYLPKKM